MRLSRKFLADQLEAVAKSYRRNELAYLTMTGAVELPIRDRLAWSLHTRLGDQAIVVKEWNRRDIVIFRPDSPGEPEAIIELKSMGLGGSRYLQLVEEDLKKAALTPGFSNRTRVFGILLVTYSLSPIPEELRFLSKTFAMRNRPHALGRPLHAVLKEERASLREQLQRYGASRPRRLNAGQAFGIRLAIDGWVIGPVRPRHRIPR